MTTSNSLVTDDGLVLKNVEKIEEIGSRMESRIEVLTQSWQICRNLRRDFNLISSKVYKISRAKESRNKILDLLMEVALQAADLESRSSQFTEAGEPQTRLVPLRIVSAEASMLFNSMKQADRCYGRLNWARTQMQLTERQMEEIVEGYEIAYGDLKRFLFKANDSTKTAGELGKDMGIS